MKKTKDESIITKIIAVIIFMTIIIISAITVASTAKAHNLAFISHRFYVMKSDSQPEIAKVGDLVITKRIRNNEIQNNNHIVYKDGEFYYCDEVIDTKKSGSIVKMIIAEKNGIKYQFSEDDIEGKVVKVVPKLGSVVDFFKTPIGIVVYIISVIVVFTTLRFLVINKRSEKQ